METVIIAVSSALTMASCLVAAYHYKFYVLPRRTKKLIHDGTQTSPSGFGAITVDTRSII